jgi:hypothetical protein
MSAKRAALAALMAMACGAGCSAFAQEAGRPLQGRGFAIAPPAGAGWSVVDASPDNVVFLRRPGPFQGKDAPYLLTAGVQALSDAALAQSLAANPSGSARAWLRRRLQAPGRDWIALDVSSTTLNGARCAAYEATQVDHQDPERILPDQVGNRMQYVQYGRLCAHSQAAGRVVLVFFNERFRRDEAPEVRAGVAERLRFFEGVQWVGLR